MAFKSITAKNEVVEAILAQVLTPSILTQNATAELVARLLVEISSKAAEYRIPNSPNPTAVGLTAAFVILALPELVKGKQADYKAFCDQHSKTWHYLPELLYVYADRLPDSLIHEIVSELKAGHARPFTIADLHREAPKFFRFQAWVALPEVDMFSN